MMPPEVPPSERPGPTWKEKLFLAITAVRGMWWRLTGKKL